jgi:hypothetical protein
MTDNQVGKPVQPHVLIDMDSAHQWAYDLMWAGKPSPFINPFADP